MPSPPGAVRDRATGGASRAARSPGTPRGQSRDRRKRQPGPPGSGRGGGAAYLTPAACAGRPGQLATRAPARPPRRCTWPGALTGGHPARQSARERPGCQVPAVHGGQGSRSPQPGISPGCQARFTGNFERGRAYHSPCTSRVPAVDLSWTWPRNSRPAADLTRPRQVLPAHGQDRDAARRGQVTARSTRGRRQVDGRSTGGRPEVNRRYTPGQWRLAAWVSAPFRYP